MFIQKQKERTHLYIHTCVTVCVCQWSECKSTEYC